MRIAIVNDMAMEVEALQRVLLTVPDYAGTNDRLSLRSDFTLHCTKEPIDYAYRPSVNVFFKSLAQYWKHKATAVLYQLR